MKKSFSWVMVTILAVMGLFIQVERATPANAATTTTHCGVSSAGWAYDRYIPRREHGYSVYVYKRKVSTGHSYCIEMYKNMGTSYSTFMHIRVNGTTYSRDSMGTSVSTLVRTGASTTATTWLHVSPKTSFSLRG